MSQKSVKAFAQAILKRPGGLHILVNNAGLGYTKKSFTEDGVGMLTQVRKGLLELPEGFHPPVPFPAQPTLQCCVVCDPLCPHTGTKSC